MHAVFTRPSKVFAQFSPRVLYMDGPASGRQAPKILLENIFPDKAEAVYIPYE